MKEKFSGYLIEFYKYLLDLKNYSLHTAKNYQASISKTIEFSEIYYEDDKIIFDITKYRIKIASENPKTINKKLSSIRSFVKYLETKNITVKLIGANSIKSTQTLPKPIQTRNIFKSLEDATLQEKVLVLVIYSFGLRISEVASLQLEDIKENWITVQGKGNKQRQVPSNKTINTLISHYILEFEPKQFLFEKKEKPMNIRQLQYIVNRVFKRNGIKATPHQLRHSFATDLLNDGARINDISELLGHSSLKATGIYTKLNTNTKLKQYNMSHPLNK